MRTLCTVHSPLHWFKLYSYITFALIELAEPGRYSDRWHRNTRQGLFEVVQAIVK